jgi:hypothetical protein
VIRIGDRRLKSVVFAGAFALYLAVGYWLQVRQGFIVGDSLARAQAAGSVMFSRDPHLAAIGFVFTPLTAMVQIPAVALGPAFPALLERAYAASLISAAFMAGAVVQILTMGLDRGLPRRYVLAITAMFALHPMIVFYGSNGMSEAPFIFFATWATRRLILWVVDDDVHHLVAAGAIAMALAYLSRYDGLACVVAAGAFVAITTYLRAPRPPRIRRAVLDLVVVSGPGIVAFLGWAAVSWLITGETFAQFSSLYGNAEILKQSGAVDPGFVGGMSFSIVAVLLLAPALVPLAFWAGAIRWRRPRAAMLAAPAAVFGSALLFQMLAHSAGSTFPFLRFYIIAIPFAASLALLAVPDGTFVAPTRPGRNAPPPAVVPTTRGRSSVRRYTAVAAVFALCVPVGGWGMSLRTYAPQEYALAEVIAPEPDDGSPLRESQRRLAMNFSTERRIARYLDGMQLPDGSVLTDTVFGFAVVAASKRPKVFVVPSDADFARILNNPAANGVRYLLTVPVIGRGTADKLNRRYPTLYDSGADVATLELEIPNDGVAIESGGQPDWRLYRVLEMVPEA